MSLGSTKLNNVESVKLNSFLMNNLTQSYNLSSNHTLQIRCKACNYWSSKSNGKNFNKNMSCKKILYLLQTRYKFEKK